MSHLYFRLLILGQNKDDSNPSYFLILQFFIVVFLFLEVKKHDYHYVLNLTFSMDHIILFHVVTFRWTLLFNDSNNFIYNQITKYIKKINRHYMLQNTTQAPQEEQLVQTYIQHK